MALSRITTWASGNVLTASALNAEFDNILDNALSLISPITGTLNINSNSLTNINELHFADSAANATAAGRLRRNGTVLSWHNGTTAADVISEHVYTAKGSLLSASAASTAVLLTVGTNGQVLKALSSETTGLVWAGLAPSFVLTPESAMFPATNFPQLVKNVGTNQLEYTLDFDQTTGETAMWRFKLPTSVSFTTATIEIATRQAAATSGTLGFIVTSIARGNSDAWDTAGAADTVTAGTVDGTAGDLLLLTKALTVTGWDAGDVIYLKLTRDVSNDTVAEDGKFVCAVVKLA